MPFSPPSPTPWPTPWLAAQLLRPISRAGSPALRWSRSRGPELAALAEALAGRPDEAVAGFLEFLELRLVSDGPFAETKEVYVDVEDAPCPGGARAARSLPRPSRRRTRPARRR